MGESRSRRAGRIATCAVLLALVAGSPAAAAGANGQGAPSPLPSRSPPLPPVRHRLPEVRVEATPNRAPEHSAAAFVTRIDLDARRGEALDLETLLGESVGVQVRRFGGPGERAEVSIRGSTAEQVVILLDGVRLNTAQSGAVDLSTVPLALLRSVEIARGAGSVDVGTDAIGGVVRLESHRGGGPPRTRARLELASFGRVQGSLLQTGSWHGFELALGYEGWHSDGDFRFRRAEVAFGGVRIPAEPKSLERINNENEGHAVLARVGRALGKRAFLQLTEHALYRSRGEPGLDTGSGQRKEAHSWLARSLTLARLELAPVARGGGHAEVGLYHRLERSRFRDPIPLLGGAAGMGHESESQEGAFGLQAALDRDFGLGAGVRVGLHARLEAERDGLDRRDRQPVASDQLHLRHRAGLMLRLELAALHERLLFGPALRYDRTEGFGARWLPQFGVVVRPIAGLRLQARIERAFRAPNLDELFFPDQGFLRGNPRLRAESATDYDLGLRFERESWGPLRSLRLEAAAFRRRIDDSIVWALVNPFTVAPVNTRRAEERGYELEGGVDLGGWAGLSANATWLHARLLGSGARLPGRAGREVSVRLRLGRRRGALRLLGEMHTTSRIPVSLGGHAFVPARTLWNASLIVELARLGPWRRRLQGRDLRLTLSGQNLTDRAVRDARFFPQPGRRLLLRLEAGF